ncbi:type II secretion system protein GspG [Pyxidicoccus sp. 3LG]
MASHDSVPSRSLAQALKELAKVLLFLAVTSALTLLVMALFYDVLFEGHSRQDCARADLRVLEGVLRAHFARTGQLPDRQAGLDPLVKAGLLETIPMDPWGRPYAFSVRGDKVEVWSLGADGQPGGTGRDEDLVHPFQVTGLAR